MIQCGACDEWYHTSCLHVPQKFIKNNELDWNCKQMNLIGTVNSVVSNFNVAVSTYIIFSKRHFNFPVWLFVFLVFVFSTPLSEYNLLKT